MITTTIADGLGTGREATVLPNRSLLVTNIPAAVTTNKFSAALNIRQTANTAAGNTIFGMRVDAASQKSIYVEKIYLIISSDSSVSGGNTARYNLLRFNGADLSGGTAITPAKLSKDTFATEVTNISFLDTGLTTFGIQTGNVATSPSAPVIFSFDNPILLQVGDGLAIQVANATRTGVSITGYIIWSEV
jgi:hypothetical protein